VFAFRSGRGASPDVSGPALAGKASLRARRLLQIAIGIVDLGAAALAMYVLIPAGLNIGIFA